METTEERNSQLEDMTTETSKTEKQRGGGGKEKKKKNWKKKEYSRNLVVNLAFLLFLSAFLKDIHHILWAIKYILCVYKPVTLSK